MTVLYMAHNCKLLALESRCILWRQIIKKANTSHTWIILQSQSMNLLCIKAQHPGNYERSKQKSTAKDFSCVSAPAQLQFCRRDVRLHRDCGR